jgi:hypothetical protein
VKVTASIGSPQHPKPQLLEQEVQMEEQKDNGYKPLAFYSNLHEGLGEVKNKISN